MIVNIRKGVFETNSSSSHSVCLSYKTPSKDAVSKSKVIRASQGEYGWGIEILWSFAEKLDYIVTAISYHESRSFETVGESYTFKRLQKVVEDFCGLKIEYNPQYEGYIDHQSIGKLCFSDDQEEFKTYMLDLLFNPESHIIIDNDNHD